MEVNNKKFYRLIWFRNIIQNGLLLHGLRNRLARIGFDFMPYYWVQEGVGIPDVPVIRGDSSGYVISFFGEAELKEIKKDIIGIEHKDFLKYYKEGQICVGLKQGDEIVSYMFIKPNNYTFRGKTFQLKGNEVYMHSMYTFESFRGKNLAPYLRYHCYQLAKEKGFNTTYSVSEYFNTSTIKFKKKLNTKPILLILSIILFKKFSWNFTLRNY